MTGGLIYNVCEKAAMENNTAELANCKQQAAHNLKLVGIQP